MAGVGVGVGAWEDSVVTEVVYRVSGKEGTDLKSSWKGGSTDLVVDGRVKYGSLGGPPCFRLWVMAPFLEVVTSLGVGDDEFSFIAYRF